MLNTDLKNQMPIEQLMLLYKQSAAAFFATIAVLLYIIFWIHDLVEIKTLSMWVSAIVVLNIYLLAWIYFVNRATKNTDIDQNRAKQYILTYQIQSLMHGFSWGMLPFLLMGISTPEMKFFAYIVLCGMAAGAIGTTAMIYHIYLSFMLPMMLPIIITQLYLNDSFQLFSQNTVNLLIIFVASLIVLAHTHYESVKRSITLFVENKELLNKTTVAFEKTEAESQAKSSFLANMSHELRTPLNAIIGYSEIIHESVLDDDFKTIANDAEKIISAGKHLLSLINNVLDLSKIESGKMDVYIEDINIQQFLYEIKATTEMLVSKNKNAFIIDMPENIIIIKSDITKLRQILFNIISNAAKFTEHGEVSIRVIASPENINIHISDTGIGMTKKQLEGMSVPFTQADISTTRKYGGTGLGMNLTGHLTQLLGIEFKVNSVVHKGTSFYLTIPLVYKADN